MKKIVIVIVVALCILLFIAVFRKPVARCMLKWSGWKPLTDSQISLMKIHKKLVMVFPHTSHMDGYMLILYKNAYPEHFSDIKFLVNPIFMKIPIFNSFLESEGAVKSAPREVKNNGKTEEVVNNLNKFDSFKFLLSPKGTIQKKEWRSGFYYIAKGSGAKLTVVGLDYINKCVVLYEPMESLGDLESAKEWLTQRMKTIPQKHPERVEY